MSEVEVSSEDFSVDIVERTFRTGNIIIGAPGLNGWSSGSSLPSGCDIATIVFSVLLFWV